MDEELAVVVTRTHLNVITAKRDLKLMGVCFSRISKQNYGFESPTDNRDTTSAL